MREIWQAIEGYEGKYEVSNLGNVKSLNYQNTGRPQLLRLGKDKDGYSVVKLSKDNKQKAFRVARLVALAFIPNPDNLPEVNHIDEDKTNNQVSNLEWATHKENVNYGTRTQRAAEKTSKPVYCVELDRVFANAIEAGKEVGRDSSGISKCCRGWQQTCGNYHWRYADENEKAKD